MRATHKSASYPVRMAALPTITQKIQTDIHSHKTSNLTTEKQTPFTEHDVCHPYNPVALNNFPCMKLSSSNFTLVYLDDMVGTDLFPPHDSGACFALTQRACALVLCRTIALTPDSPVIFTNFIITVRMMMQCS